MRQDTNLTGELVQMELDEIDLQILALNKQIPIEQNIPLIKKIIDAELRTFLKNNT